MTHTYLDAKPFEFPAMHTGQNPQRIIVKAEASGDAGLYQEIAVSGWIDGRCIGDVIIGVDAKGEFRVLCTADVEGGDGDKKIAVFAVFPQRSADLAVERFD